MKKTQSAKCKVQSDPDYPSLLKGISGAPKQLFWKGAWDEEIFKHCLAVVGSRRMTTYGKKITEQLVGEIAAAGVTVVSGFMYGIDATAHRAALRVGGRTIAVMPCGIDLIHPDYQKDLYEEILQNKGLILSEFEGIFQPTLWTYPKRNRIVAGLCQATLVVEAGEKSGSLITAHFAKKYARKVFVVPGPLTSSVSTGIIQLIRDGASVVGSAKDILDFFRSDLGFSLRFIPPADGSPTRLQKTQDPRSKKSLEEKILEQLRTEPMEIDELARFLEIPVSKLGTALSLMQLSGIITEEGGKYRVS